MLIWVDATGSGRTFKHLNILGQSECWNVRPTPSHCYYSRQAAKHAKVLLIDLKETIDGTGDAVVHECRAEIQQITQLYVGQAEVSEKLFFVGVGEPLDALEFNK